jgi:hypothetical protein
MKRQTDKITGRFFNKILTKMFKIVGATYIKEFITQEDWYLKYSWDTKQENEFKEYFIKEYQKFFKSNKKTAVKEFEWFNLDCGWTNKDQLYNEKFI